MTPESVADELDGLRVAHGLTMRVRTGLRTTPLLRDQTVTTVVQSHATMRSLVLAGGSGVGPVAVTELGKEKVMRYLEPGKRRRGRDRTLLLWMAAAVLAVAIGTALIVKAW